MVELRICSFYEKLKFKNAVLFAHLIRVLEIRKVIDEIILFSVH